MTKYLNMVLMALVFAVIAFQQGMAEEQRWGNDVLVHQANHINGFGLDQADKDTLFLVVSDSSITNVEDTFYVYRSTNNGSSWAMENSFIAGTDMRLGKADIVAAKGDSNFVFVFYVYDYHLRFNRYRYSDVMSSINDSGISDGGEMVTDFAVCKNMNNSYYLYVVYQTDDNSTYFKRSTDYGKTWAEKKDLSKIGVPTTSQLSIASDNGNNFVVAGKTADNKIYTIRNNSYGLSTAWKNGQYPSGISDCGHPAVAASYAFLEVGDHDVFWVFYERLIGSAYILSYHYSTDACSTWSAISVLSDTSSGNRLYPSLHCLKKSGATNLTLAYRYEVGADPREIRYSYNSDGQTYYTVWPVSYTGVNDYAPDYDPPQKAYTIRKTDNSITSAVLYVSNSHGLYFDASAFSGVENEIGNEPIKGFSLSQNYPNPFNVSTAIEYTLDAQGQVAVIVYNIIGQKIKTLFEGHNTRGKHRVVWDGTDDNGKSVASGIYFCRAVLKDQAQIQKMVLTK